MNFFIPTSSLVTFLVYEESEEVMGIAFESGAVYMYENVSVQQWREIISSESVGSRLNAFFKYNPGIKAKNNKEATAWVVDTENELNSILEDAFTNVANYYGE